jgi:maltooligosyltrehalose trehalohydrolase
MLWQGEEYGEPAPFQFFADHIDEEIATATREGRRREFASFAAFAGEEVPDPGDPATFERSKLTRARDGRIEGLYRDLLRVRRELPPGEGRPESDRDAGWIRVRRGAYEICLHFGTQGPATVPLPAAGELVLATHPEETELAEGGVRLPPQAGALVRLPG